MPLVVIVEDEVTLAETLADNLREEGHEVQVSGDGENGLALVRSALPDLVVLDIMLPDLDGLSVCRIIRRDFDHDAYPDHHADGTRHRGR